MAICSLCGGLLGCFDTILSCKSSARLAARDASRSAIRDTAPARLMARWLPSSRRERARRRVLPSPSWWEGARPAALEF